MICGRVLSPSQKGQLIDRVRWEEQKITRDTTLPNKALRPSAGSRILGRGLLPSPLRLVEDAIVVRVRDIDVTLQIGLNAGGIFGEKRVFGRSLPAVLAAYSS